MKLFTTILAIALLGLVTADQALSTCCTPKNPGYHIDLIAAQHYDVGDINVQIVNVGGDDFLEVTYSLRGDFSVFLSETHLEVVCDDPSLIPQTPEGNPIPGNFTYQMVHDPFNDKEFTYQVPLDQFTDCDSQVLYIAAHAVVVLLNQFGEIVLDETGWGRCVGLCCFEFNPDDGSWGTYFAFGRLQQ
jgi:hypothetical protein